ncbi:MAG TPA: AAA domain-containing protein [Miltoncostaeaceae bacterium]|nr:AAA domain-containing protein [Miltoncostaeaceae bacterium]
MPEVELVGRRAEFREALREEIEAASRASSSSAVGLREGRRIAQIGAMHQYLFQVESALQLPDDTPADLIVGDRRYEAIVVSVSGLAVTLSIPQDLGQFVPVARLQTDMTFLLRKLIDRIEAIGHGDNVAGDRLLEGPAAGTPATLALDGLNPQQHAALEASLGRDLTFIWGPPGTGKTHTIGAIGTELHRCGRSLLLVSHTNVALDQALLRIGEALERERPGTLEEGKVFRLGTPRDKRLQEQPELLLATHRTRRSAELEERRLTLEAESEALSGQVRELSREVDIREWVLGYAADLARIGEEVRRVAALGARAAALERGAARIEAGASRWTAAQAAARDGAIQAGAIAAARDRAARAEERARFCEAAGRIAVQVFAEARAAAAAGRSALPAKSWPALAGEDTPLAALAEQVARALDVLVAAGADLAQAEAVLPQAERLEPGRAELEQLPTLARQQQMLAGLRAAQASSQDDYDLRVEEHRQASELLEVAASTGGLMRRVRGLPDPEEQRAVTEELAGRLAEAAAALERADGAVTEADALRARIERLTQETAGHPGVPRVGILRERIAAHQSRRDAARAGIEHRLEALRAATLEQVEGARLGARQATEELQLHERALAGFMARYWAAPEAIAARAAAALAGLAGARDEAREAEAAVREAEGALRRELERTVAALRDWGLSEVRAREVGTLMSAIARAYEQAKERTAALRLPRARAQIEQWNRRIVAIEGALEQIAQALGRVEADLIAGATIVAATLTSAYLRDELQARRFDTVLLDEASMAPIPALWVAAARAEANVVAVGDNRQLSPICVAEKETAKRWLGRDVFDASAAFDEEADGEGPVVQLLEQRRMHPQISRIPNRLVYKGRLVDGPDLTGDRELADFYMSPWSPDAPVTLLDTGSLDAWVTSVARGAGSSRLNFLSAAVCVDVAEAMLRPDRPVLPDGAPARILIVTPYRAQARLLALMLRENGIEREVRAGTAHSFQGSEAPVVLLDLVNDDPHWRVGMFMASADEDMRRLFNVAITRAKCRLVVVGDFDYVAKLGKKAFVARLLAALAGAPRLEARLVVPSGLAARAAAAKGIAGDHMEAPSQRLVLTQDDVFRHLAVDLDAAAERVVIYSPFITHNRLAELQPHLKAIAERGVALWVITKPLGERAKGDQPAYRELEETLRRWGARVVHKARMHEKLVIVDRNVLWQGSLNPLSYRDTQELMERRDSAEVVAEYEQVLRLDDLVGTIEAGDAVCPCCGADLQAAEATNEPFYWQCSRDRDCYSRSAGEDPPRDGRIACSRCGGRYELGTRGTQTVWKCQNDGRHYRALRKGDLRLPRMREGIPKATLERLLTQMEIVDAGAPQQRLL